MQYDNHLMREWLSSLRRDLHQHPETAFEEYETTARVKHELTALGIELTPLDDLQTGCTGLFQCRQGDKVLGLRADLDALNITERNDAPYTSKPPGKMHACGHDANTAIMLGVAKNLVENRWQDRLKGRVKFIFQPAEEGVRGARAMIKALSHKLCRCIGSPSNVISKSLPPRSEANPACKGWCRSPVRWHTQANAWRRFSSLACRLPSSRA